MRTTFPGVTASAALRAPLAGLLLAVSMATLPQQSPSLDDILRRAGRYAQTYHREFTSVLAEEHYVQRVERVSAGGSGRWPLANVTDERSQRTLRSDFMLLRGEQGETAWLSFRDIFEVDGKPVTGERGRLEKWLRDSRASFASRARALALDQARYNIGDIVRTINVPLLPLEFLTPENQQRFRFRVRGRETILGIAASLVAFEERSRPTLIRTPAGDDVPASGLFWIDPSNGRVLKTELRTGERGNRLVRTTITVSYEQHERLNMLVPQVMAESYHAGPETITGSARYSNYRRFETDVRIK